MRYCILFCVLILLSSCQNSHVHYQEPLSPNVQMVPAPIVLPPRVLQEIIPVNPTPGDASPRQVPQRHADPFEYI